MNTEESLRNLRPGDSVWIANDMPYAGRLEEKWPPLPQYSGPILPSEAQIISELFFALAIGWGAFYGIVFGLAWLARMLF